MNKRELIYKGKAKNIYSTDNNDEIIIEHTNHITAFNNLKDDFLDYKGEINQEISTIIFNFLNKNGIDHHLIKNISKNMQLCKKVEIIPIEIIVRNEAQGSICKNLNIKKGLKFKFPIIDFTYKDDTLGDPIITESQIIALDICSKKELEIMKNIALSINSLLVNLFHKYGINLADFKIELGRYKNKIILADEISPDCMRLIKISTMESLDKDLYRHDKGNIIKAYQEILKILKINK